MIFNIIIGLFGLGLVVCFHEAGHFIAAKLCGVKVEAFSIGWGKKIFSFKKGETEYCISLLPMGGYCKMKGEQLSDNPEELTDTEGTLHAAHPMKKAFIYFAGPFMNLIFSIAVLSIIWMCGFTTLSPENRIVLASEFQHEECQYPADKAGLKTGDYILAVNNRPIHNFQEFREEISLNAKDTLFLKVLRDEKEIELVITPDLNKETGAGKIGVYPWVNPIIGSVVSGSSAFIAGFEPGDRIISVEGQPVDNYMDIVSYLWEKPSKVAVVYSRNGQNYNTELILNYDETGTADPGFSFLINTYHSPKLNFFQAIGRGTAESFRSLAISVKSLKLLFGGVKLSSAVSGPIRITYMMGDITTKGFAVSLGEGLVSFFKFVALINIALFFMNLLPIPALDGGGILLCIIELLARKKLSPKAAMKYQMIGFSILITLMIFTFFNDIIFLIRGKF